MEDLLDIEELKAEATGLGIQFAQNIGAEKLKAKIDAFYESQETSGKEIQKKGYYKIEDMQMQNLEKTEELYLHTIEQQKQIDELKDIVKQQQKQIDQLLKK